MRQRARKVEVFKNPIVKRAVHLKFQRTDTVGDALDVIAQAMGEIVHRIDAPFVTGVMVLRVADAVQHRVAHPDVRRRHVDPGAERAGAVGVLAPLHAREQIEVLLHPAIAEWGILARAIRRAAVRVDVLGREVTHISQALPDECQGVFVQRFKVVRGVEGLDGGHGHRGAGGWVIQFRTARRGRIPRLRRDRRQVKIRLACDRLRGGRGALRLQPQPVIRPGADEPLHVFGDRIHVLDILLGRVGVVHAEVADAAELPGDAEIKTDALRVANMKIAVRLGWKACVNRGVFPFPDMPGDDVADEIGRRWRGRRGGVREARCHDGSGDGRTVPEGPSNVHPHIDLAFGSRDGQGPAVQIGIAPAATSLYGLAPSNARCLDGLGCGLASGS